VRLKKYLEMRGADGGPWRSLCALPALWVGLLYDQVALDAAWDLVKNWTTAERAHLRADVPRSGLRTSFRSGTVRDVALEMLAIARDGLARRARNDNWGDDETHFLDTLQVIAESGRSPADELLEKFNGPWGGSVDPVFKEYAY
jgi:glutamate--cysteine ligase